MALCLTVFGNAAFAQNNRADYRKATVVCVFDKMCDDTHPLRIGADRVYDFSACKKVSHTVEWVPSDGRFSYRGKLYPVTKARLKRSELAVTAKVDRTFVTFTYGRRRAAALRVRWAPTGGSKDIVAMLFGQCEGQQ